MEYVGYKNSLSREEMPSHTGHRIIRKHEDVPARTPQLTQGGLSFFRDKPPQVGIGKESCLNGI